MESNQIIILASLIFFKMILIGIGFWSNRFAKKDESSFLIGGRSLGPWVAGLSYAATSSSAWVLLGFSGFVFSVGLSALWMLPGIWVGYIIVWVWLGHRLRSESEEKSLVTAIDFISADTNKLEQRRIGVVAGLMIIFCFSFYVAAQLQASGAAMMSFFDLNMTTSIFIGASVILLYSLLGGFWAVSVTDMIQGLVMATIAIVVPTTLVWKAGGFASMLSSLSNTDPAHLDFFSGRSGINAVLASIGAASIGIGTAGQPQLLSRVMAVKGETERRRAFVISLVWAVVVFSAMAIVGLASRALLLNPENPETLLLFVVNTQFSPILAGIALAALLSAVMSTVDSLLLTAAAAASHDIGLSSFKPGREVLIARIVMTILCLLSVMLALGVPATIFERVLFAWTALGAAFGPTIVVRVLGFKPSAKAILLAMILGFSFAICFSELWESGPGKIYERILPWVPALTVLLVDPFMSKKARNEN